MSIYIANRVIRALMSLVTLLFVFFIAQEYVLPRLLWSPRPFSPYFPEPQPPVFDHMSIVWTGVMLVMLLGIHEWINRHRTNIPEDSEIEVWN